MRRPPSPAWLVGLAAAVVMCSEPKKASTVSAGTSNAGDGAAARPEWGGGTSAGASQASGAASQPTGGGRGGNGGAPAEPKPTCVHPAVSASCEAGFCTIPAGCFIMGIPRESKAATPYSTVETEVELTHAFLIGETEVTRAEWFELELPEPRVNWHPAESPDPDVAPQGYESCLDPECPVVWLSFEDAATYTNLLSLREGLPPCYQLDGCVRSVGEELRCTSIRVNARSLYECPGYRLPTEAEWEYAAKAGTMTDYYSGDMAPESTTGGDCNFDENLDRIGWYCGNSGRTDGLEGGRPHHVALKMSNAFGLYDVSGNAFEWTNDRYHPDGYGTGRQTDPVGGGTDPTDLTSPHIYYGAEAVTPEGFATFRVIRGGSFDLWAILTVSGRRGQSVLGAGTHFNGFRVVRTLDPDQE